MRHQIRCAFALALLALLVTPTWAKDEPADAAPRMADAKSIRQRHMQLKMQGHQAGGITTRLGRLADGGILMETEFVMKMKRGQGPDADVFESKSYSLAYYDADRKLRWKRAHKEEAGVVTTEVSTFGDTHVDVLLTGPASRVEKRLELPKDYCSDVSVFHTLLAAFKKGGKAHAKYSVLDVSDMVFELNEMTVVKKTTITHGGEAHEGYLLEMVAPVGPGTAIVDHEFFPMHMTLMGVFEMIWVDESPLEFTSDGWEISSFVPVEGAAPMAPHLEALEVTVTFDNELPDDKPVFTNNRYQTVKREGQTYHLTLASTLPPKDAPAHSMPLAVDDKDAKRFLGPTPQSQSDDAAIIEQARKIVGGEKDALTAVRRIVVWVYGNLEKRGGRRGNATAVEVLKSRVGDCTEHAALTVALCRAAGIPSRNMGGLVYVVRRDGKPAAGYHAWAEVWLGRWIGVDATIPEVGTSARYVMFEVDEPGEKSSAGTMLRLAAGKPRLRVKAYRGAGGERTLVKR